MKKDDIIGQKLFETCKLSAFYLDLISNSKFEDESPMQLATAYANKLYEIVERYDKMLEANKQREQLSLTFDNKKTLGSLSTPLGSTASRTSTPNKPFQILPHSSSNQFLTTKSNVSTPLTPSQSSTFLKASVSNYSLNQRLNNKNSAAFSRYSQKNLAQQQQQTQEQQDQQNYHSTLTQARLLEKIAAIYNDSYEDDEEDDELDEDDDYQENTADDHYDTFYGNSGNKFNYGLNIETLNTIHSANLTNKCSTASSNLLCSINTIVNERKKAHVNSEEDSPTSTYTSASITSNNTTGNNSNLDFNNNTSENQSNQSNIIEKSFSNLSKDSGVFASDGYNSDYSTSNFNNNLTVNETITSNGVSKHNGDLTYEESILNENSSNEVYLNSPSSLNDDEDYQEANHLQLNVSGVPTAARLVWNQIQSNKIENKGARIVKAFKSNQIKPNVNVNSNNTSVVSKIPTSLKEQYLINKLKQQQQQMHEEQFENNNYRTYTKYSMLTKPQKLLPNLHLPYNFINKSSSEQEKSDKLSLIPNESNTNLSLSSTSPSTSPSTLSSNTSVVTSINENQESDFSSIGRANILESSSSTLTQVTPSTAGINPQQFFFNNYNSLMNVSMLDNIDIVQATNASSLEFDNMNSSILTFN